MRVLADYTADLGARDRPRAAQARAGDDRAAARRRALAPPLLARRGARARRARSRRAGRGGCPTRRRPERGRRAARTALDGRRGPLALRNRALVELVYSAGPPQRRGGRARPRRRRLRAGARPRPRGKGGEGAVVPLGEEAAYWLAPLPPRRRGPSSRAAPRDALFLSARGRRLDTSHAAPPHRRTRTGSATRSRRTCSRAAPTCA